MTHTSRAIIIGGGIAGPAAALFLRRAGIDSRIFEAYPEPTTIGGGFQIAPNGMRVLRTLGLADQVAAAGVPSTEFVFRNRRGHTIGRIDVSPSGYGVTMLRAAFHRILLDETTRCGIPVIYGKRLHAIEQSPDTVVAHFEDGTMATGEILLASDGVHSRARALVLPAHSAPRYTGFLGVGGFAEESTPGITADAEDARQLNFTMGPRLQFGYATLSLTSPRWGWWTHLPQERELTRAELQSIPDSEFRDRVLAAFRGLHAPVEGLVSSTARVMRTAIYDVPTLPTWHVGRVMLLGDAAHAMSPAGGQGASLALEDAMVVGVGLGRGSEPVAQTFAAAESVLRVRAERMVRQAADNDRRQLKQLGTFGQWIRDRLFPVFVPFIARELEHQYAALQDWSRASA